MRLDLMRFYDIGLATLDCRYDLPDNARISGMPLDSDLDRDAGVMRGGDQQVWPLGRNWARSVGRQQGQIDRGLVRISCTRLGREH